MRTLEALSGAMHEVNDRFALPSFDRHVRTMQDQVRLLETWLGEVGEAKPTFDRVRQALQRFHERQVFEHVKDARLVCFGCTEPVGAHNHRLIEDRARFPRLLESVDRFRGNVRSYRRCYRGLLFNYFAYDGEGAGTPFAGRDNWQLLRTYLRERVDSICTPGHEPEWVPAIQEHRNLLSEAPCEPYARQLLQGNHSLFEEAKRRLDVPGASWLVRSIVIAQVRAATLCEDTEFRGFLPALFNLLSDHPLLANDALAQILTRYSHCQPPDEHAGLRDFAVAAWGNPWLRSNAAKWGLVDDPCRQMVAAWLKRDLMKLFFELLSQDGRNDKRRFEFWAQYLDKIEDMYFALGPSAYWNDSEDFRIVKAKMEKYLRLSRPGSSSNNAFIMVISGIFFVEFGVTGNACYVFKKNPIEHADRGAISADSAGLKSPHYIDWLPHVGRGSKTWEENFAAAIQKATGEIGTTRAVQRGREEWIPPSRVAPDRGVVDAHPPFQADAFTSFVKEHGLAVTDNARKGGSLWVHTGQSDTDVARRLRAWGFAYSDNKHGWWRRDY